jgi:hypothetical protein
MEEERRKAREADLAADAIVKDKGAERKSMEGKRNEDEDDKERRGSE